MAEFAVACAKLRMVSVLNEQWLETLVAGSERHDAKGEIAVDSPLRVACSSALGKGLATLIAPPATLKGIITDLDNTVWRGIIGDAGVETARGIWTARLRTTRFTSSSWKRWRRTESCWRLPAERS